MPQVSPGCRARWRPRRAPRSGRRRPRVRPCARDVQPRRVARRVVTDRVQIRSVVLGRLVLAINKSYHLAVPAGSSVVDSTSENRDRPGRREGNGTTAKPLVGRALPRPRTPPGDGLQPSGRGPTCGGDRLTTMTHRWRDRRVSRRSVHAIPGTNAPLSREGAGAGGRRGLPRPRGRRRHRPEGARSRAGHRGLQTLQFGSTTVAVRVNGTETPHYYRDLIAVVEQAGAALDTVIVPRSAPPATSR